MLWGRKSRDVFVGREPSIPLTSADYEKRLNPKQKLPAVSLEQDTTTPPRPDGVVKFNILGPKRVSVGEMTVSIPSNVGLDMPPYIVFIETERGKGYGKAAYKELIKFLSERGLHLSSGGTNTYSDAIWEWLVKSRVARLRSKDTASSAETVKYRYETI